ncbi:neuropeptide FF receptor 1-like [Acropora millepora]|uniref:neuropeptide FF receptor 1-like n=1 Tax=Acropora millepora TaxID=45264 RepID=UPI001CF3663D|nr:neuropeptide FF receptor 1-like [Acropora millepora]
MEEITIELLVIETVIFIIGLVGNIFVLVITCKAKNKTIHGTFVASLAIADLVLLCFDSPTNILQKLGTRSNIFNCRIHLIATTAGYNAGLFSITSMALHRYFVVTHPWRPKLKRKNALIWISLIWIGALTLVIPLIVVIKPGENTCHEVWPLLSLRQAYTATLMSVQYVLPLVITAICYVKIWLFLRRRPFASQSRLRTGESTTSEETSKESVVILKTVAVIVVLFLVLLLPTQVAWVLLDFKNVSFDKLWFASEMLTRVHSCLNPIVYGVLNRQYRRQYINFLCGFYCYSCSTKFSSNPIGQASQQTPIRSFVTNTEVVRVCPAPDSRIMKKRIFVLDACQNSAL